MLHLTTINADISVRTRQFPKSNTKDPAYLAIYSILQRSIREMIQAGPYRQSPDVTGQSMSREHARQLRQPKRSRYARHPTRPRSCLKVL